jgi:hypothetical protein
MPAQTVSCNADEVVTSCMASLSNSGWNYSIAGTISGKSCISPAISCGASWCSVMSIASATCTRW